MGVAFLLVLAGGFIFKEKYYGFISLVVAVLGCVPLFCAFEKKENTSKELAVISVMVAISVAGRFIFTPLPGFKPVTAITVLAGIYMGKESGFAAGALSAVISNFYFGQGPWTPFQMLAWGMIGFAAGALSKALLKHKTMLYVFGALAGVGYSLFMDVWTALWVDGTLNAARYTTLLISSIPLMVEYGISNVLFLFLLNKPFGKKLERIKAKYGLFC